MFFSNIYVKQILYYVHISQATLFKHAQHVQCKHVQSGNKELLTQ